MGCGDIPDCNDAALKQQGRSTQEKPSQIRGRKDLVFVSLNTETEGVHHVRGTSGNYYGRRMNGDRFNVSQFDQSKEPERFVPLDASEPEDEPEADDEE